MKKLELALNKKSIGYWSACGGVEVKEIINGIDDKIECISNAWCGKKQRHLVKVYYGDRDYIIIHGYRLYLDECLRMG